MTGILKEKTSGRHSNKTVVIIPVHNRKMTTQRCLNTLVEQGVNRWADIVVVDDGSTDGTAEMLHNYSGRSVTRLSGDGNLWWGGAIRKGMEYALRRGSDCMVWLNDDCLPREGALRTLVSYATDNNCVAVGKAVTPTGCVYGARRKAWNGLKFYNGDEDVFCDTFCGNIVAIARKVVDRVGLPDIQAFPHQYCDVDYGLSIHKAGIPARYCQECVADNDDNGGAEHNSWLFDADLKGLWKSLFKKRSVMYVPSAWRFVMRHWGFWGVFLSCYCYLKLFGYTVVRLFISKRLLLYLFGSRVEQRQNG